MGINDRWIEMEIGTGAAVSLISCIVFDRHRQEANKLKLSHMTQKLVTYTGEMWSREVNVKYDNTLLGRNWQDVMQLSWNRIHQLKAVNDTPTIKKYLNIFKDELGELRNYTASLRVNLNTKPIFYKACHVLYAL